MPNKPEKETNPNVWIWMNKNTGDCVSTRSISEFIRLIGANYNWSFNTLLKSKLYRTCDYVFWACGEVKN